LAIEGFLAFGFCSIIAEAEGFAWKMYIQYIVCGFISLDPRRTVGRVNPEVLLLGIFFPDKMGISA
jgi:hypothetical protein